MKTFFNLSLLLLTLSAFGIDVKDTRLLSQPAISDTHVAFIYAEDLWVANVDGSNPRRLTVDEGIESLPAFSPDGKLIAFSAQYDGNTDVFIIPVEGGVPARLTWHPGNDWVRGFTPDGKQVVFASQRTVFTNRYQQLFTVSINGGFPVQIEIPNAFQGVFSPDGKKIAYSPLSPAYKQWKHYRGGTISTLWIFSSDDKSAIKIPQPTEGCNDSDPMWIGNTIYFRSDRNGEFNLFSYDVSSRAVVQITKFTDFPVVNVGFNKNKIVLEQSGYLHLLDVGTQAPKKLTIGIAADLLELRPRYLKGGTYVRSGDISPSGARVVFDFRGDIITVPAEKGDARNITLTTNVHEKFPTWSPDGKSIAYFSDASGEYELHIQPQDGKEKIKAFKLNGAGFYAYPHWSPDGKKISYVDNSRSIYVIDVGTGVSKKIDSDELYSPGVFRELFGNWSADSKWIAYDKLTETNFKRVYLYSIEQGKSFAVTDGLSDASEPKIDPSGKYLYFFASTDAGPVVNWFDQSNNDMRVTNGIYLVTLQKGTISPFAKESDEEVGKVEKTEPSVTDKPKGGKKETEPVKAGLSFQIDWEGIHTRIVDIPITPGNFSQLSVAKEGELFYVVYEYNSNDPGKLHKYDITKRKDSEVMELNNYVISADTKKMLYQRGFTFGITNTGEKPEPGKGVLNINDISVKVDPPAEWAQIFDEAWRINRDYFYDPGMHGADWPAMKKKYAQFLPHIACRGNLNTVIEWMCSELVVGHHRLQGAGDRVGNPEPVSGGLLGADYTINNNRYQIKKIYGGLNWNPELRSPLTEPGINAAIGDYILAVNGKEIFASQNLFSFFENTSGKITEVTLGQNPTLVGSRTVKVVPIGNENALRNRDWVEGNLKKVTAATNGQVAYVYVPNTANLGHEYFKRYFYPQANRKAVIIDERFNGGGQIANYYIDLLQQPYQSHWNTRYGKDFKTPNASIQGPKVMLIDETAGSGGDMLPWMFRKFKVGTLVGKRTWGGLVGVLGFPEFIDGASVTAPNVAIWTQEGFIVENVGVPPDIEVEQLPGEVIKGNDPQLQKAIDIALEELKKNPPTEPKRPAFPIKVKN
ncbi:MAG: PD40 domain-containing protein [Cytophagales bacterium]|nr:PD40 domain-containing protein [Cytophagales bacterium]